MYLCQRIGNMTLSEIADTFDLASYASAGSTIRSVRKRMEEHPTLKEHVDYILLDLTP
jgi:chromosomal replication initiation ATPase DnaA